MLRPLVRRLTGQFVLAVAIALLLAVLQAPSPAAQASPLHVDVSFPASLHAGALDGRLLLMLSAESSGEPRFQISDSPRTQQVFGIDVNGLGSVLTTEQCLLNKNRNPHLDRKGREVS